MSSRVRGAGGLVMEGGQTADGGPTCPSAEVQSDCPGPGNRLQGATPVSHGNREAARQPPEQDIEAALRRATRTSHALHSDFTFPRKVEGDAEFLLSGCFVKQKRGAMLGSCSLWLVRFWTCRLVTTKGTAAHFAAAFVQRDVGVWIREQGQLVPSEQWGLRASLEGLTVVWLFLRRKI